MIYDYKMYLIDSEHSQIMASNKPSRNPGFMKCTRPYCKECRPRFSSTPVSISEVRSLENARVPVSNVPPRAEKTVAIGISRVPTVQQTKSAVGSLATLSIIGVHRE